MLADSSINNAAYDKNSKGLRLRNSVIEAINELLEDINNYHAQIAEQSLEHIHQKYVMVVLFVTLILE